MLFFFEYVPTTYCATVERPLDALTTHRNAMCLLKGEKEESEISTRKVLERMVNNVQLPGFWFMSREGKFVHSICRYTRIHVQILIQKIPVLIWSIVWSQKMCHLTMEFLNLNNFTDEERVSGISIIHIVFDINARGGETDKRFRQFPRNSDAIENFGSGMV